MGALSMGEQNAQQITAPHNLLSSTYTESFLESKLAAAGAWHPYPNWSERGPWEAVPEDIRTAIVERAESDRKAGWKALLATTFLDFKRNGNRTFFEADSFGRRSMLQRLIQLLPTGHAVTAHLLAARTEIEEALALAPQHKP